VRRTGLFVSGYCGALRLVRWRRGERSLEAGIERRLVDGAPKAWRVPEEFPQISRVFAACRVSFVMRTLHGGRVISCSPLPACPDAPYTGQAPFG
jgi:hypothetical protein